MSGKYCACDFSKLAKVIVYTVLYMGYTRESVQLIKNGSNICWGDVCHICAPSALFSCSLACLLLATAVAKRQV